LNFIKATRQGYRNWRQAAVSALTKWPAVCAATGFSRLRRILSLSTGNDTTSPDAAGEMTVLRKSVSSKAKARYQRYLTIASPRLTPRPRKPERLSASHFHCANIWRRKYYTTLFKCLNCQGLLEPIHQFCLLRQSVFCYLLKTLPKILSTRVSS